MKFTSLVHTVVLAAVLTFPAALAAQSPGKLVGRILDASSGQPLGGARITIVGTALATTSAVDGRYTIAAIPAGIVTLRVLMIGYGPKTVTAVRIEPAEVSTQDVTLAAQAVQLGEITVSAELERGSVNSALDEQRHTLGIMNAVTAEQIASSPDGDAAAALQRVSGATVQDGKYVFVRGLGDRYTTASLNGSRIPSPEPEKKVVPLDLFPASLLSAVTTSKTFTPDQSGDFSGAAVDIRTRDYVGRRFVALSVSSAYNDAVTARSGLFAQSTGLDWLALGAGDRALPASLARADFTQALPAAQVNGLVGELRNVWSPRERSAAPNASASVTMGGNLPVGANGVSYLVSGTYSAAQEVRADQVRALATTQGSGEAEEVDRFTGNTGRTTVLWGGIANASTTIGTHSKVSLNNTYNRTMDNEGRRESGYSENLGLSLEIQRLRYVERNVLSTQLSLHHELGGRHMIDWGLSRSSVGRREPDRSEIVYARETEGAAPAWYGFSNEAAVRTFADLSERSLEANASWQYYLGEPSDNRSIKIGGQYRSTDRVADNNAYSISLARPLSVENRQRPPEELFGGAFSGTGDDFFRIVPLAAGGSYTARDRLAAAFAMVTWPLLPSVDITGGARVEQSTVRVSSLSTVGTPSLAEPAYTDLLPSVALTWRAGADVNFRFSVSQTLSRPEYRELSPILYREVIGFDNVRGNPDLRRALIQNYDIRWEWYPNRGEIISVGVFAKEFTDPIERIYLGSSGTRIITYVNARGASNRGVEVELRKHLGAVTGLLRNVAIFTNATVMKSTISIDPDAGSITNASRRMVGQAPYVVNAGLTWTHPDADASATVLFNRVGSRITEAGELPLPDVIEQARSVLDVSLRFPIAGALDGRVDARNLLDTPYLTTQGDVTRERYRAGRVFAVGFSWKP